MESAITLPGQYDVAFKEWAAICAALRAGRQGIILRKGGIHEGPGGFVPEQQCFWLYPTNFHQDGTGLTPEGAQFLDQARLIQPPAGRIRFQELALVGTVYELKPEEAALALEGLHVWSQDTVRQRFHYRKPGLFVLLTRIYRTSSPVEMEELSAFAGCKTWVELPSALAVERADAAISDDQFQAIAERVLRAIG